MGTDTKQIAGTFYQVIDAISTGKMHLDALDSVLADHFRAYLPGGECLDRNGFKEVRHAFTVAFPGSIHTIEDVIAEGNRVAMRVMWRGKHTGPFQSTAPTNAAIEMSTMAVMIVEDGKVTELWPLLDSATFLVGVGLVKPS